MSLQERSSSEVTIVRATPDLPVGGAILDKDGREVVITEEMVQAACQACDKLWVTPEEQN
ncbi:PA1571 family protein [Pseudomonas viridiflava]